MTPNEPPVVYTIGHGAGSFSTLSGFLDRFNIATVIDVRTRPYSRHAPDFRRETLEHLTTSAGFGYRWMGDTLGGLGEAPEPGAFLASLHTVLTLTKEAPVVLLCAETDPAHCHRSTILAPALEQQGARVVHILSDGSTRFQQPTFDW
jgi:uncharacterized protein (DUF488 family)